MAKLLASQASGGWAAEFAYGGNSFATEYGIERKLREASLLEIAPVNNNLVLAYIGQRVLGMPRFINQERNAHGASDPILDVRTWQQPRFLEKAASRMSTPYSSTSKMGTPVREDQCSGNGGETLDRRPFRPARYVRVNAANTPWYEEDLASVLGRRGLAGVCLPKVESAGDVNRLSTRLTNAESYYGLPDGEIRIVAAIESARSITNLPVIASASDRLMGLMFGAEDFALDLGLGTHRVGRHGSALRSLGCGDGGGCEWTPSIDGVFPDLDDEDGMSRDLLQARRLGFSSKSTFNPRRSEGLTKLLTAT